MIDIEFVPCTRNKTQFWPCEIHIPSIVRFEDLCKPTVIKSKTRVVDSLEGKLWIVVVFTAINDIDKAPICFQGLLGDSDSTIQDGIGTIKAEIEMYTDECVKQNKDKIEDHFF